MSVDEREVARIARLAHLHYDDSEVGQITDEMNRILDHVTQLRDEGANDRDRESLGPDGGGTGTGPGGTRAPGASAPDVLSDGPATFSPNFAQGFFSVPAPPGVSPAGSGQEAESEVAPPDESA